MNKQHISPRNVVVDLVLKYSATMPGLGHAAVLNGNLVIAAHNHRGQYVSFGFPVHFDGESFDGNEIAGPRFVLFRIAPTVWKLKPSLLHDLLHAYITIVGVPDDAPWAPAIPGSTTDP